MKHLKTFESHSTNEAWEDVMRGDKRRREEKIAKNKKLGIKAGDFVNIKGEFDDVWHEVEKSMDGYITYYKAINTKQPEVKTDLMSLADVRDHSTSIPSNARYVSLKTGYYRGDLSNIPKFYRRNMDIDSIVGEED